MAKDMDLYVDMVRPDSGCGLANDGPLVIFQGIFTMTSGEPCDDCGYHTKCKFLSKRSEAAHARRSKNFGKHAHETNAETAKKSGISKRQVAKMRRKGESLG